MQVSDSPNIGLFVISEHQNYFLNLYEILAHRGSELTIFTNEGYKSDLEDHIIEDHNIHWVIKSESERFRDYIQRIEPMCGELDILILFPIYGLKNIMNIAYFSPNCKTLLMIYNSNLWTASNLAITHQLHRYIEMLFRKRVLSQVDAVMVEYSPIKKYLENRTTEVDVYSFTPIVFDSTYSNEDEYKIITIPGSIDPNRRDYQGFFRMLEQEIPEWKDELKIQLLGSTPKNKGRQVIQQCDRLRSDGWNIEYFSQWVPVSDFERGLKVSDVLVAPIRKKKKVGAVTELYGVSKASGCFGDAIRYGKPIFVPNYYSNPGEIYPVIKKYKSQVDLAKKIISTIDAGGLTSQEINYLVERFSVKSQSARLLNIINSIIHTESGGA